MSQDQLQDHTPLHLFAKLRCGWGKIAMPKPQTSVYQRPISFQEGFFLSTAQDAAQHQPSDDALNSSVGLDRSRSVLAEELANTKVIQVGDKFQSGRQPDESLASIPSNTEDKPGSLWAEEAMLTTKREKRVDFGGHFQFAALQEAQQMMRHRLQHLEEQALGRSTAWQMLQPLYPLCPTPAVAVSLCNSTDAKRALLQAQRA